MTPNAFAERMLQVLGWSNNGDRFQRGDVVAHDDSYEMTEVTLDIDGALDVAAEEVARQATWFSEYHEALRSSGKAPSPIDLARRVDVDCLRLREEVDGLSRQLRTDGSTRERELAEALRLERERAVNTRVREAHLRSMIERRDERISELEQLLAMRCPHGSTGHPSSCGECVRAWMMSLGRIAKKLDRASPGPATEGCEEGCETSGVRS